MNVALTMPVALAGIAAAPCAALAQDVGAPQAAPPAPSIEAVASAGVVPTTERPDDRPEPLPPSSEPPRAKPFSVFLTGGTLGLGPEVRYRFAPQWGVRASGTYIGLGLDANIDGVDYDGDLRLGSAGIAIDHFLGENSDWHVSIGLRYDANEYRIRAEPAEPVTIGERVYTPEQIGRITGRIEGEWQLAPTLTVGHVWGGEKGVQFGFEAGAMFHKALEVNDFQATGALGNVADFLRDLAAERDRVDRDLDKLNVFPLVQILVGFRF